MWAVLQTVFIALLIVGAGFLAGGWLAGIAAIRLSRSGVDPLARELVASLVKPVIVIVAVVAALQWVGVDLTSITAILGAATLAIGLSLRDSLANVASGAVLLTLRPFTVGDVVDVAGESGTIVDLKLFMTRLKTFQGVVISVPNANITKSSIRNYTRNGSRRIDIDVDIASGHLRTALDVLPRAAESVEAVLSDPAPASSIVDNVPGGAKVRLACWVETAQFGPTRRELLIAVDELLAQEEIERVAPLRALLERRA